MSGARWTASRWGPSHEPRAGRRGPGPPAGAAERHLRHRLRADPGAGHHGQHHARGRRGGRPPRGGQAGPRAALRQGRDPRGQAAAPRHDRGRRGHPAARPCHGRVRHPGGVMKNPVGPILRMGDEVEQVIAAIEDDNPDTDIEVIDRGAYFPVQGDEQIVVTERTLRRYLGADYEIRSFGTMMTAFNGRVITTSDTITWESGGRRKSEERKTEEKAVPA